MAADMCDTSTDQLLSLELTQAEKDDLLDDSTLHVSGRVNQEHASDTGASQREDVAFIPIVKTRRYINYGGNFVTGLDTTTKEAAEKRVTRASRFGIDATSTPSHNKPALGKLHSRAERFGTAAPVKNGEMLKFVKQLPPVPEYGIPRPNAVLVHGTNEMSTKDVLQYFAEYGPSYLEWINDVSCNAVWEDPSSAQRALLGKGMHPVFEDKDRDRIEMEEIEPSWRVGEPHPLSKQLLLRYATDMDVKVKGASQKSKYYKKYGNPNVQRKMARYRRTREGHLDRERESAEVREQDDDEDEEAEMIVNTSQSDLRELIGRKRPLSSAVAKPPSSGEESEGEGERQLSSMVIVPPPSKTLRCDELTEDGGMARLQSMVVMPSQGTQAHFETQACSETQAQSKTLRCDDFSEEMEEEKMEVEVSGRPHVKGDDLRDRLTRKINIMKKKMTNVKSRLGTKPQSHTT